MDKKQKITNLIYAYKWENKPLEETVEDLSNITEPSLRYYDDDSPNAHKPAGYSHTKPKQSKPTISNPHSLAGGPIPNPQTSYGHPYVGSGILQHICPNNSWQLQFWGSIFNLTNHWHGNNGRFYAASKVDFNTRVHFDQVELGKPYVHRVMQLGQEIDTYVVPYCRNDQKSEYRCIGFTNPNHKQPHYGFHVDERIVKASDLLQPNQCLYAFL